MLHSWCILGPFNLGFHLKYVWTPEKCALIPRIYPKIVLQFYLKFSCHTVELCNFFQIDTGYWIKVGPPPLTNLPLLNHYSNTFWNFWQNTTKVGFSWEYLVTVKNFQKCWENSLTGINWTGWVSIFYSTPCRINLMKWRNLTSGQQRASPAQKKYDTVGSTFQGRWRLLVANLAHTMQGSLASSISSESKTAHFPHCMMWPGLVEHIWTSLGLERNFPDWP